MPSDKKGTWRTVKQNPGSVDPLSAYQGQPMISSPGPDQKYLGRVIVEFYEDGSANSDANKIAYSVNAVDGDYDAIAMRIAKALVARLEKQTTSLNQQP